MSRWTKKPVTIEATQWLGHEEGPAIGIEVNRNDSELGWLDTLEGGHVVTPGDWIITGVKGERYPCKPDIFFATYSYEGESL